jgi:Right handed beta helix region
MTRATLRARARRGIPALGSMLALAVGLSVGLGACSAEPAATPPPPPAAPVGDGEVVLPQTGSDVAAICGNQAPGPAAAPAGAVSVDPAAAGDLATKTKTSPPGTTFWLAPGVHTLGPGRYSQVQPKNGNVYLGAPGAVIDGRGINNYAFTTKARDVTIRHLTIRGFTPPTDQGVVNHDSGNGWVIEHNTIEDNDGAALMAGARQQVRYNCLRNNGQYGMNAYQPEGGIVGLVVEHNEIVGNNTDDWETKIPGCGCTGGIKFWSVNGADVRANWIHGNYGPALWADTNNNDFLVEGNLIEDNDGEAVFYETSYNLVLRKNVLRRNTLVQGKQFADDGDDFPVATIYLSEAGGEPRVPARTDKIEITDNVLQDNWSGITAWENADRFCNSPANTSTDSCTRLVSSASECAQPAIASKPLYDDCRWKTQRVDVHGNTFSFDPASVGCATGYAGRMSVLSNYGTYPDWSPYKGEVVQQAITRSQNVQWRNNTYVGPWAFMIATVGRSFGPGEWQGAAGNQDTGSTFDQAPGAC